MATSSQAAEFRAATEQYLASGLRFEQLNFDQLMELIRLQYQADPYGYERSTDGPVLSVLVDAERAFEKIQAEQEKEPSAEDLADFHLQNYESIFLKTSY